MTIEEVRQQGAVVVAPVGRIDSVYGDRNVMCTCPPLSAYED